MTWLIAAIPFALLVGMVVMAVCLAVRDDIRDRDHLDALERIRKRDV